MQKLGFCQRLGLGWTVVACVPTVGIRSGNVIGISHQGITVANEGLIETFTQSEAEKMLFVPPVTERSRKGKGIRFLVY